MNAIPASLGIYSVQEAARLTGVPPRQAVTRPGDLWLLCADSTEAASVRPPRSRG